MRIAIDARIIKSTSGRYIVGLLDYLQDLDNENDYLILVRKKDWDYYKPRNPRFKLVEANFANYSLAEQFGLLRLLNRLQPDLVHFCMPQQPVLYRGKHVTTVHDLTLLNTYNSDKNFVVYKVKQFIGRYVFHYVARSSIRILTPSQFTKDEFVKFSHVDPDKIIVTYEGSDVAAFAPKTYKPMVDKQFIMYVGQQSDYKNIRRLMQAHQQLRSTHPELLLVLVGRLSPAHQMNKNWAERQSYQGIVFTDFLPDDQLNWLYKHCAAYVFPSLMEGFGLPGLEAMSAGAPVASSDATCLPEVYKDAAHYFDPLDVDAMAACINDIITDKKLRSQLIAQGAKVAKLYSWKRMAKQTLAVYKDAAK